MMRYDDDDGNFYNAGECECPDCTAMRIEAEAAIQAEAALWQTAIDLYAPIDYLFDFAERQADRASSSLSVIYGRNSLTLEAVKGNTVTELVHVVTNVEGIVTAVSIGSSMFHTLSDCYTDLSKLLAMIGHPLRGVA